MRMPWKHDNQFLKRKMPKKNQSEKSICSFIEKLWDILKNSEFDKILLWNSTGTSFTILNPSLLESTILPVFFRHSKLKSFVRQLNMYGFRKSHRAKEYLAFSHPDFQRDNESKLPQIRRRIAKRFKTASEDKEIEDLPNCFSENSQRGPLATSNHSKLPLNHSNGASFGEDVKGMYQGVWQAIEIRSYGRLIGEGQCFAPFISPYSYTSIKSERKMIVGEAEAEKSSMEIDAFKNVSTDEEGQWPYAFTSCEYFL